MKTFLDTDSTSTQESLGLFIPARPIVKEKYEKFRGPAKNERKNGRATCHTCPPLPIVGLLVVSDLRKATGEEGGLALAAHGPAFYTYDM